MNSQNEGTHYPDPRKSQLIKDIYSTSNNAYCEMEKEKLIAEMSAEEKRKKAEEIFNEFDKTYFPVDMPKACQEDFKMCSLVAYKLVKEFFDPKGKMDKDLLASAWGGESYLGMPLTGPEWLPIRYLAGNMCFGRVFSINLCAFPSKDSIIGMRDVKHSYPHPKEAFRILKGLKYIGDLKEWTLFKLDPASTDDMTAMLYTTHEKNFDLQFAHFPHEGGFRVLFFWVDS